MFDSLLHSLCKSRHATLLPNNDANNGYEGDHVIERLPDQAAILVSYVPRERPQK